MGIRKPNHNPDERGANLVEFAILAPLLLLLVMGIVEFGWLFGQYNDVRHGAREGARLAAVNAVSTQADLHTRTCDSMDLAGSVASVRFTDSATGKRGEEAKVKIVGVPSGLSGVPFITAFLPETLVSEVRFVLEQDSVDWGNTTLSASPPLEGFACP